MNIDIRLSLDFFDHPKSKKLKKKLLNQSFQNILMTLLKSHLYQCSLNQNCNLTRISILKKMIELDILNLAKVS